MEREMKTYGEARRMTVENICVFPFNVKITFVQFVNEHIVIAGSVDPI